MAERLQPKGDNREQAGNHISIGLVDKGKLIEFRLNGEPRLAVLDRPDGKKDWIAIDGNGQSHKLRPQRVEYEVGGSSYQASDIASFLAETNSYLDPSGLEVAWELLVEGGESVTPSDLAQILFSDVTPVRCYAAHRLLSEDRVFFKKKGDRYEPRPSSQVEEIQHQIAVEVQRQQEKEDFIIHVRQALAGESVTWTEGDRSRLELIERFVLQPELHPRNAQDVLAELGRPTFPEAGFALLVELNWWSPNENLFLRRSAYPVQFPQKAIELANQYLQSPPPDPDGNRSDMTELKVYTIDDASTEEIDDGLSAVTLPDGNWRIWIHIADPSRLISPGDLLDLEARRRSTSLYLPTGMIPMFPPALATGPMSLIQGQLCPALSLGVILDGEGAIADCTIQVSQIQPTYRLTYQDADELLELGAPAEPELLQLAEAAERRKAWRRSRGSIDIQMPEASIKVDAGENVAIDLLEGSQSRQLVAEMMILAGEAAGQFCRDRKIVVPFRGQPQPELPPPEELLQLPAGPVRFCAIRRCMPRSEVAIAPLRHASLGLDAYTQVTSPIRRYTDLLTHFQIKAHLRGDPLPFSADQMQEVIFSVTQSAQEAVAIERQTNRYWCLEYLRRNSERVWQALMLRWLREDDGLGLILIEELGVELPHRFDRKVNLGDRLQVQVSRVDPRRDEIRFREVLQDAALL